MISGAGFRGGLSVLKLSAPFGWYGDQPLASLGSFSAIGLTITSGHVQLCDKVSAQLGVLEVARKKLGLCGPRKSQTSLPSRTNRIKPWQQLRASGSSTPSLVPLVALDRYSADRCSSFFPFRADSFAGFWVLLIDLSSRIYFYEGKSPGVGEWAEQWVT